MQPSLEWNTDAGDISFEDPETTYAEQGEPIGVRGLFWLFFQPTRFFSNPRIINVRPYLYPVIYLYLIYHAIYAFERRIELSALSDNASRLESYTNMGLLDSWGIYWLFVMSIGAMGAMFIWWIAMWWYELRLRWSDAKERNLKHIRAIFGYSSLVVSVPAILFTIYNTFAYSNYREAYGDEGAWWTVLILVFLIWAPWVSYRGVRAVFPVTVWKARLWFLILPWSIFVIAVVAIVALFTVAMLEGNSGFEALLVGHSILHLG